jgi:oligoribonuclease (3'-5' exoribonuclease)
MIDAKSILKQLRPFCEERQNFLPAALIMIDLEMTGVIPDRDDILQIAMLKLTLKGNQYEVSGEPLEIFVHSDKKPSNDFHRKFLMRVFAKSNESEVDAPAAKQMISKWLGDLEGKVVPTGDAIQCDLAFLYAKGVITRGDIVNDENVPGTFNHEIFDLNALKCVSRQKLGAKEDLDLEEGIHDAMVDCRNQLVELNSYLSTLLG